MAVIVVAIVEDDETVLRLLAELLNREGFRTQAVLVDEGQTLEEIVSWIEKLAPDAILLDVNMPVRGDDIATACASRPRLASCRRVLASGSFEATPSTGDTIRVEKPFDIVALTKALRGE